MNQITVVYSEPEARDGTFRVVDAETGEFLMCGTKRPEWWARAQGHLMVPPPPDPGSRIGKVVISGGRIEAEWIS